MQLTEAPDGKRIIVVRIDGGRTARRKIMDLGIIPGVPVTVVKQDAGCPLILEVLGRRIMMGRGMAKKVHVR